MERKNLFWDNTYSVGIERFDDQHRNFFRILEDLSEDKEHGASAVRDSIDGLLLYVTEHFHAEESLMTLHEYPGYEDHVKEHEKLMAKTQRLYSDMDAGNPASVELLRDTLVDWILNHIATIDQAYVPFFRGKLQP